PEAVELERRGCDAIVAQGWEAGGHRGLFLDSRVDTQAGLFALIPQVADAVTVPVIAAGGVADARGIAAAMLLGASAVQIGTAYLFCPEAIVHPLHLGQLHGASADSTVVTNIFTGRPARAIVNRLVSEVGPIDPSVPPFPLAGKAVAPLRAASERAGSPDFAQMWSGQAAGLCHDSGAAELTIQLATGALALLASQGKVPANPQ